jgi:cholesterol transport system auxiliary component
VKRWTLAAIACVLAGCVSTGERQAQRYYVLESSPASAVHASGPRAGTVLLAPTTASTFYDTQSIAYSRAPGMRAYYQYHGWAELPARRIGELLGERMERSGAFRTVASVTSPVRGGLVLSTHLAELYHDAAAAPGTAQVSLTAELTDPLRGTLVARRSFSASAGATSYDAPGAVQGFNQAITLLLDDVTAWVDGAARSRAGKD